ncbi:MAG: Holliday junction branch migration protein RuvA [Oscillospiraceae bacterium]|jgi:Holliday junction DNA helicase RuvA
MLYCLRGNVLKKDPSSAVIDCGGICFQAYITTATYADLPAEGEEAVLYTCVSVRQDQSMDLYGFSDERQMETFKLLTTVSGVGPKSALSILSAFTPDMVASAVQKGEYGMFTQCSGIGTKTAQRIVLDLKGKMKAEGSVSSTPSVAGITGNAADAIAALVNLGFSRGDAREAVSRQDPSLDTGEIVRLALQSLSRG